MRTRTARRAFARAFAEALPLWLGVVPFGVVYAAVARGAGLSAWEIQLMSLLVYAGGAQFSAVRLSAAGAAGAVLILATAFVNLRHVLYGLSLASNLAEVSPWRRAVAAFFLVDESYALTTRAYLEKRGSIFYLLGSGMSLYIAWNIGTAVGLFSAGLLPDPRGAGLDVVFPLTFSALLTPLLRRAQNRVTALAAFLAGLAVIHAVPGGGGFIIAALLGVLAGLPVRD